MTKQADLQAYVFEGVPHPLYASLRQWMDSSARFTAFVETYRDKIRKKVRVTRELESALDLSAELELAYCLLNDRRFTVTYEPYASEKRRGADYAVTYRANLIINIEVARIRAEENGAEGINLQHKEERLLRILLDKLGQMQPNMANLLAVHTQVEVARAIDLDRLMQVVKTDAEGKNPAFYALSRYSGPADFYKNFARLSGILLWSGGAGAVAWNNKQARPTLDEKVLRLIAKSAVSE